MTNAFPPRPATPSLTARDTAFVVHLADESAGPAQGRVEHVVTGRTGRFASVDELLRFMRGTLAAIVAHAR